MEPTASMHQYNNVQKTALSKNDILKPTFEFNPMSCCKEKNGKNNNVNPDVLTNYFLLRKIL